MLPLFLNLCESPAQVLCFSSLLQEPGSVSGRVGRMRVQGALTSMRRGHHKGSMLSRRQSLRGLSALSSSSCARGVRGGRVD